MRFLASLTMMTIAVVAVVGGMAMPRRFSTPSICRSMPDAVISARGTSGSG